VNFRGRTTFFKSRCSNVISDISISVHCDGDYTLNSDTMVCFKVVNETRTWTDAKQICKDEGAHLAIIDTGKKLNAYKNVPSK
jgi:hypothetical protein